MRATHRPGRPGGTSVASSASYTGKTLAATLAAVPRGAKEAAFSLGLAKHQSLLKVELPIAARTALPAFGNEIILTCKATTLEARGVGIPEGLASAFFADQIEASKLIQFVLMADWRRSGSVPADRRSDLKTELRSALDRLRTQFIEELLATQNLRADPGCKVHLAKAAGEHGERHRMVPLYRIGLDRGLARVCGD